MPYENLSPSILGCKYHVVSVPKLRTSALKGHKARAYAASVAGIRSKSGTYPKPIANGRR